MLKRHNLRIYVTLYNPDTYKSETVIIRKTYFSVKFKNAAKIDKLISHDPQVNNYRLDDYRITNVVVSDITARAIHNIKHMRTQSLFKED